MLSGICFGEDRLTQAADEGVESLRVDASPKNISDLVVKFSAERRVKPLFLIHDFAHAEKVLDAALGVLDFDLELLNEVPEMDPITPEDYIAGVNAVARDAILRGFTGRIIAGAPGSNIGTALRWYSRTVNGSQLVEQLPATVDLAFHWYPKGTQDSRTRPWVGDSIEDSLQQLVDLADGQQMVCSEWGYHTKPETKHLFWTTQLTDEQVYDYLIADFRLFDSFNVTGAYAFQWRDGPGGNDTTEYGLHEADGVTPKRSMAALRKWRT